MHISTFDNELKHQYKKKITEKKLPQPRNRKVIKSCILYLVIGSKKYFTYFVFRY